MEYAFKDKCLSTNELKSNTQKSDAFKSSNICRNKEVHSVCNSTVKNELKLAEKINHENKPKSSKITSVLDPYCKTNILDESSDFVECEFKNKLKCGLNKSELLLCEICKEDITHLDVNNREVHVNNCIDKQVSCGFEIKIQTSKTENVFILECPLCFKEFLSPELRSNHIKKCGKSKGLSTQSIIQALELQERHALERISLGLPAKPLKPPKLPKNSTSKKAIIEPKSKAQSDIQLAKALSLSLTDSGQHEDAENVVTPLILKPPTVYQRPGKKPKKVLSSTPLLVLRTEEDRNRLLLDKVAAIVSHVNSNENDSAVLVENDASSQQKLLHEISTLWHLSSKASEKYDYYVGELFNWIRPSDADVGVKLCHLSQIPGHEIITQLPCEYTFTAPEDKNQTCNKSFEPVLSTDSSVSVIGCLRSLVASSWMSDVDIYTSCGTIIPAHRLLLAVRCPPLKHDSNFCLGSKKLTLKWETVPFDTALQFLNFIYTGNIEVKENMLSDLFYLANKYEVLDLQSLLNDSKSISVQSEMELDNKTSQIASNSNLSVFSSPPLRPMEITEDEICESQGEVNMDLEIVFNCINSSFKPSQLHNNKSFSFEPVSSSICNQKTELSDGKISPRLDYSNCEFVADRSESNISSNCLLGNSCPTSPMIFNINDSKNDVNDSSDNEKSEFSMSINKSDSGKSNHNVEELDLCSTESSSSQDSVKLLKSNYASFNSICKTPGKVENDILLSPNFLKENKFKMNDLPRDSQKCSHKDYKPKTISCELNEFHVEANSIFESSVVSHSKILCKDLHCKGKEKIQTLIDVKIPESSNDLRHLNEILENQTDDKSSESLKTDVAEKVTTILSPVIMDRTFFSDVSYSEYKYKSSTKDSPETKSKKFSTPESYKHVQHISPKRNAVSHEVFICNSNDDSKSDISNLSEKFPSCSRKMDFSLTGIQSNILNANSSNPTTLSLSSPQKDIDERNNVANAEIICYTFDDDNDKSFIVDELPYHKNKKKELNKAFPSVKPNKEILVMKDHHNAFSSSHEPLQDPATEACEYFEQNSTFQKDSEISQIPSPKSTGYNGLKLTSETATPSSKSGGIHPQFELSESPVTPLPDYKSMMTPEIKQALSRIGVKALPRKKAVALLSHVYNETHPLVSGVTNKEVSNSQVTSQKTLKEQKITKPKKRKNLNENVGKQLKKQQKEVHSQNASQESDDNSSENSEWVGCVPEISFSQLSEDSPTKTNTDDIESIKQYIQSNEDLFNNILNYKPLNMVEFHQELKNNNIKISIQKLMDFLDEQCITFTCPRKEEYRKKQTARAQRFRKNMINKLSQQLPA